MLSARVPSRSNTTPCTLSFMTPLLSPLVRTRSLRTIAPSDGAFTRRPAWFARDPARTQTPRQNGFPAQPEAWVCDNASPLEDVLSLIDPLGEVPQPSTRRVLVNLRRVTGFSQRSTSAD